MNTNLTTTVSPRRASLLASMLKGAAVNTVIQALGGNLKKETFFKSLLVGALGGVVENLSGNFVLPGIMIGGGNALINKSSVPQTMIKYAAWSLAAQGVKSIGEAKAAESSDPNQDRQGRIIDPFGYLNQKGINYLHAHPTIIREATFDEAAINDVNITANTILNSSVRDALKLVRRTKQFQAVEKLFEDKANALFFIEFDATGNRSVVGNITIGLRDDSGKSYRKDPSVTDWYEKNPGQVYWVINVQLHPEVFVGKNMNVQIANLAVAIGHELFIHSAIDTLEMWKEGKIRGALENAFQFRGETGDYDHTLYVKGKRQRMNQYLTELKKAVSGSGVGVSVYDIQQAINEHDNGYKHLKNR